jgi:hypothetical protein
MLGGMLRSTRHATGRALAADAELTEVRRAGGVVDALLADHGLFHLEADLRWIDLTVARLAALAKEVRP